MNNLETVLKLIALVSELSVTLPQVVAALKGTLEVNDEKALKAALDDLQAKNKQSFLKVSKLLDDLSKA